jgi:long-chain acyl-CoA synthetase
MLALLDQAAAEPTAMAMTDGVALSYTWAETADLVLRIANAIRSTDLPETRRVMVMARNHPLMVAVHAALFLAESCAVPVNFHLTAPEISYLQQEADARLIFVDETTEAVMGNATSGRDVQLVNLSGEGTRSVSLHAWIAESAPRVPTPDQVVLPSLLFTSGTTGRPKAVQLPPATIGSAKNLAGFIAHIAKHRHAAFGTHLVAGPLYHNGPLGAVRLLLAGRPLVIPRSFDAPTMMALIVKHRVETSIMVPTHFVRLLALPETCRASFDVSSIKNVAHTGGACPIEVKRAMLDWWGPVLYEAYGGTESGTTCAIGPEDWLAHPGSVGRAVAPFAALIVDEEGRELPVGQAGRLYFRDQTGRGIIYEGDPDKTAAAHIAPGVFTLGEIGRIDEDGFVYITDRFSDMVVSGGVNIYPAETEQALVSHPDVVDAACFGLPDEEMGERLVAVVQASSPDAVDSAALGAWCRTSLAGYKCPKVIHFVDVLPRNPMGKLDKAALKAQYRGQTQR